MSAEDQEMLSLFIQEAGEHLETLEADLLQLENNPRDAQRLNRIFRAAHSIKGTAGFFGLTPITDLARVMQSVRDLSSARHFYADIIGFEVVNEGRFVNPRREPNNFGLPANLVAAAPMPFAILGPRRTGPTQVELVQFAGVEGRDLANRAVAPNLGVLALRFPVTDLAVIESRLRKAEWPIAAGPAMLDIRPYGRVRVLRVRAPDGAWLEFFERIGT